MNFSRLIKNCFQSKWAMPKHIVRYQSASASQKYVDVEVNDKTGITTVSLNRKPVNSLSLEFFKDFCGVMDDLEKNKIRGMILKSVR
jgi:3,2-trans-enoyl-CoA isomerase